MKIITLLDSGLEKRLGNSVKQGKTSHLTLGSPASTSLNQSARVRLIDHEEKHDAYLEWTAVVKICVINFHVVSSWSSPPIPATGCGSTIYRKAKSLKHKLLEEMTLL